ncbi:MAG: hypothetical protein ABL927_05725 [Bdellovibrionales bacterium]
MSQERRGETNSDDRRKIERITSPQMKIHFQQIRWVMLFLAFLMIGSSIFNLVSGISSGIMAGGSVLEFSSGFFVGVIFFTLAFVFWRYHHSIKLFLENESASNLDRMMERQTISWIVISLFSLLYVIKFLMSR